MMKESMKGSISISRPSCGSGREYMSITVMDKFSRTRFLSVEIDLDDFTRALTGRGETPCFIECANLDRVGKEMISKKVEVEMGSESFSSRSKTMANQKVLRLIEESGEDWVIFGGFSSQNTFFSRDGKNYAQTTLRMWVTQTDKG